MRAASLANSPSDPRSCASSRAILAPAYGNAGTSFTPTARVLSAVNEPRSLGLRIACATATMCSGTACHASRYRSRAATT